MGSGLLAETRNLRSRWERGIAAVFLCTIPFFLTKLRSDDSHVPSRDGSPSASVSKNSPSVGLVLPTNDPDDKVTHALPSLAPTSHATPIDGPRNEASNAPHSMPAPTALLFGGRSSATDLAVRSKAPTLNSESRRSSLTLRTADRPAPTHPGNPTPTSTPHAVGGRMSLDRTTSAPNRPMVSGTGENLRQRLLQQGLATKKKTLIKEEPSTLLLVAAQEPTPASPPRSIELPEPPEPSQSGEPSTGDDQPQQKSAAPPTVPEEVRESIDRKVVMLGAARNAIRANRTSEAIERFRQYLKENPQDSDVREEFASFLESVKEFDLAIAEFAEILKQRPERTARLRTEIGNMYIQTKHFRKAIQEFSQALDSLPTETNAAIRLQRRDIASQLARAFIFDGDATTAFRIFETHLADVQPNDTDAPRLLGGLLLDLDRPKEACEFLKVQRARLKGDLEVLVYFIRGLVASDELTSAHAALNELVSESRGKVDSLLFLGALLTESDETAFAQTVFSKVLESKPNNTRAQLGLIEVAIAEYRLAEARSMLQIVEPDAELRRKYLGLGGLLFVRQGEYADAKAILKLLLEHDPYDNQARLDLGGVYAFTGDREQAKAEYQKLDTHQQFGWRGRVKLMEVLAVQRRFSEALQLGEQLLAERRRQPEVVASVAEALIKAGKYDDAAKVCRDFIQCTPTPSAAARLNITLGRALLKARRSTEALLAFDAALEHRAGRIPAAFLGRAQAQARGRLCDLGELFAATANARGGRIANYIALSDLFAEEDDDEHVVMVCEAILNIDPMNLAALSRLTEARQRMARQSGDARDAVAVAKKTLDCSPTNIRALMSLARSYATVRQYDLSVATYDKVLAVDPEMSVPKREKARVLYGDTRFDAARSAYMSARTPSAEERLIADLRDIAACSPEHATSLEAYLAARIPGPELARKLEELCCTKGCSPDCAARIRFALLNFEARLATETAFALEQEAKELKGVRNRAAIGVYRRLLALEPDNSEAAFDLAQTYGTIQQTHQELLGYTSVLELDRLHRDSTIASDRASREISPQFHFRYGMEVERGRSNLVDMFRMKFGEFIQWPLGNENEFCRVGYTRVSYHPGNDRRLDGNILSVLFQKQVHGDWLLFAQLNYEHYPDRFHSRPTYDIGVEYSDDHWRLRAEAISEFVVQNAETLRQDIWRAGGRWSANYQFDRRWDFNGMYGYWHYFDGNDLNELSLSSNYKLLLLPTQLTATFQIDALSYREATVLTGPGDSIMGALHPYFTPRGFAIYQGRLSWKHYLTRDIFMHSNATYYGLQYGLAWDSEFVNYHMLRANFNHDVCSWMSTGIDASVTLSKPYTGAWVYGYVTLRWPILTPCCP